MNKLLFVLTLTSLLASPLQAQVFKWTDAEGNVHFGTSPPPGMMQHARDAGVQADGKKKVSVRDALPGSTWLGRSGDRMYKVIFMNDGKRYEWKESILGPSGQRSATTTSSGYFSLDGEQLRMTRLNKNREVAGDSTYLATMSGSDSLRLVDINVSGRVFNLMARPEDTRMLKESELAIAGTWAQVLYRVEEQIIGYIEFDDGVFQLYDPNSKSNTLSSAPSYKHQVATGKWRVEGNRLLFDFWEAKGSAASRMLRSESWDIVSVDHRRLEISDGRRTQVFRRERTH